MDSTSASEGEGRFRLTPVALSKGGTPTPVQPGVVRVQDQTAVLDRGLLREVFTASADGLRQDFVVAQPPAGDAPLTLTLALDGATASDAVEGVTLTLPGGRQLVYHRLQITDAAGQTLTGQLLRQDDRTLAITVQDAHARYPIIIDPTITDADWQVWNPGLPATNGVVYAVACDAPNSTLYVGGGFTAIGAVLANSIAQWNGSAWSGLDSGLNSNVYALVVDGATLYAGGLFTTAGGVSANYIAQWNGSAWSPLGTGMDGQVFALAVDGANLYVGGNFTSAGDKFSPCAAYVRLRLPVNGVCGSATGQTTPPTPSSNLCGAGTASAISGPVSGQYFWSCGGSAGGSTALCSAGTGGGITGDNQTQFSLNTSASPGCTLNSVTLSSPPNGGPPGLTMPFGMVRFQLSGCTGRSAAIQFTYPGAVAGMQYWKYLGGQWLLMPASLVGNTATFTIADNGDYDADKTPGVIADPSGPALRAAAAAAIPTLSEWALLVFGLLMGAVVAQRTVLNRRR